MLEPELPVGRGSEWGRRREEEMCFVEVSVSIPLPP